MLAIGLISSNGVFPSITSLNLVGANEIQGLQEASNHIRSKMTIEFLHAKVLIVFGWDVYTHFGL